MPQLHLANSKRNKIIPASSAVLPLELLLLKLQELRERYTRLPDMISYAPELGLQREYDVGRRHCHDITRLLQEIYDLMQKPSSYGLNVPLSPLLREAERTLTAHWGTAFAKGDRFLIELELWIDLRVDVEGPLWEFLEQFGDEAWTLAKAEDAAKACKLGR